MGSSCSDARKRPTVIPPIKRFSSSFEEISENSSCIFFHTAGNQNPDYERRTKNELRNVSSWSHPARLKYYDHTKTRYIDRKIVTLTERGTTKTLTISKLKITRSLSSEQIDFQKEDGFECPPEYTDRDGTPGRSPTKTETASSDDAFPILRLSSEDGQRRDKSDTMTISRSSISSAKVL